MFRQPGEASGLTFMTIKAHPEAHSLGWYIGLVDGKGYSLYFYYAWVFWENKTFRINLGLVKRCTFILPNRPSNGPPRKRDRISASSSHIGLKYSRENTPGEFFIHSSKRETTNRFCHVFWYVKSLLLWTVVSFLDLLKLCIFSTSP